ncbi:hypothetical protein Poli38472_001869 [Pythium oligandrum]|uniref:Glucosidase 2 subunit beta n=1 Tax=Pythium oligandrum TaxID=41045 RepID=A0A8K1CWV2_PYTOL|nr:hypothetical protein Poli38472_001869 [Pythium oligandrum]|eukprot:TMW69713.1 hypothetical protein Poli38472_001869 [Pythium oligandrum]
MRVSIAAAVCGLAWTSGALRGVDATSRDFHGVTPELQKKLASASTFVCDGGARKLPIERLNDNYCDCDDGSDEPGTSACSHTDARFHCINEGYFSKNLPTSRVNDQICDCCDGSDEYASGTPCPVTCKSLMDKFMAEKRELLDIYEQGRRERETLVTKAQEDFKADQAQVESLEREVALVTKEVEELEKVKDEQELLEIKERLEQNKATKHEMLKTLGLADFSAEQLGFLILELANKMPVKDDLLKVIRVERENLGDSQLETEEAAWKVRDKERQDETDRIEKLLEERKKAKEEREKARQEAIDRGETPAEEPTETEEELVTPPVEERPVKLLFDKMSTLGSYERPSAVEARKNLADAKDKLNKSERDWDKLKKIVEKEYGEDRVLYAVSEQCFSTPSGEYTYSMCFFGSAKQDSTSLGKMEDPDPANPNELIFQGGTTCWNGPARSLKVTMECGATTELYNVDEPSTCVYTAKLKTPLVCNEKYKQSLLAGDEEETNQLPHYIEVEVAATL